MSGFGWHDIVRAAIVALVVGTVLTLVNLGPGAYPRSLAGNGDGLIVAMNHVVPFTVSSITSLLIHRAQARRARSS